MREPAKGPFTEFKARWKGDGIWQVIEDFKYHHQTGPILVPAGFTSDLDSVPRIPYVYAAVKGRATKAALVHDKLYASGHIKGVRITRSLADSVFLDAMKDEGVSFRHRWAIYLGVRAGGLLAWRRHRKQ